MMATAEHTPIRLHNKVAAKSLRVTSGVLAVFTNPKEVRALQVFSYKVKSVGGF